MNDNKVTNPAGTGTFLTGIHERDGGSTDGLQQGAPPPHARQSAENPTCEQHVAPPALLSDDKLLRTVSKTDDQRGGPDGAGAHNTVRFELLGQIDLERIPIIKDEFCKFNRPLSVVDFVLVMKKHLKGHHETLVSQLIELFNHIDIDGCKSLTWQNFTSFLVDQVNEKGMVEDAIKDFHAITLTPSPLMDELHHASSIEKMYYFRNLDKIAFFEKNSKVLKMVTPELVKSREVRNIVARDDALASSSFGNLLSVEYIESQKILVFAASDLSLTFHQYDAEGNFKMLRKFHTRTSQLVLCWCTVPSILFSADHEGVILPWDIEKIKSGPPKEDSGEGKINNWKYYVHEGISKHGKMRHFDDGGTTAKGASAPTNKKETPRAGNRMKGGNVKSGAIVFGLMEIVMSQQLASCANDSNVMIWDVTNNHGKCCRILRGHEMGVRAMAFADCCKGLLSGGFDYNIFVWNTYVGKSTHVIKGHTAAIVAIEVLGSTWQAVSVDADGIMKAWDLGNYTCLQTLVIPDVGGYVRGMVAIHHKSKVLVCGHSLIVYDYLHFGAGDQTDEYPILKVIYNDILKLFLTATGAHVRIWDAVTGGMKCDVEHKNNAEVTQFVTDHRGRKVFIGDHDGQIWAYNTTTGCLIKKLTAHVGEITGLIYDMKHRNLISCSWDRSIVIHAASSEQPHVGRRARNVHISDITCMAYSSNLGLIATGSSDQVVSIREYGRLRLVATLMGHDGDVSVIQFIDPYPLLASADYNGNVCLWSVPPHGNPNQLLTRFTNTQSFENAASVTCLTYYHKPVVGEGGKLTLLIGDDEGDVGMWCISSLPAANNMKPAPEVVEWDAHRKDDFCAKAITMVLHKRVLQEFENDNDRNRVGSRGSVAQPVVRFLRNWKAHQDLIRSIQLCSSPLCVITAGHDKMTKVWNLDGTLMSVLRAQGDATWNFPCNHFRSDVDEEQIREVLEAVKKFEDPNRGKNLPDTERMRKSWMLPLADTIKIT